MVLAEGQKLIVVNGSRPTGYLHCSINDVPDYNVTWIRGDVSFKQESCEYL